MCGHAEDVIFYLLQRIHKKHLQQREIEVVQHVYDAASHQHPDGVGMNEDGWNLGEVEELLEQRRQREPEPRVELFLREDDGFFFCFLRRHKHHLIQQFDSHAIWDTELFPEFLRVQLICRFSTNLASLGRRNSLFCSHLLPQRQNLHTKKRNG